ncbi:MAG: phage baseplate assembly protein V, partial [Ferruginibacter sp.]
PKASGFLEAAMKASDSAFGKSQENSHVAQAATPDIMKSMTKLLQQAAVASSVTIQAQSHHSKLNLGVKIKLLDEKERSAGEYIITNIHHRCITPTSYQNSFTAVPAEVEVPPYTTPLVFPQTNSQPAIVTDNEDKDGLDRVKVRFPWQKDSQKTPWISALTPHAGKGKGIRFLPEIGEEVMVDFVDNNAEKPFVIGAVNTEKNQSGNDVKGNNLKVIGTRTGRRLEIDDDKGFILIRDFTGDDKGTSLKFNNNERTLINMSAGVDAKNFTSFQLAEEKFMAMSIFKDGKIIMTVELKEQGKKITIKADGGDISLSAGSINLNAGSININASQSLNMEGKAKGTTIKGQKVTVEATTDVEVKGVNATVKGTGKLDLTATGITNLKGSIVNIN